MIIAPEVECGLGVRRDLDTQRMSRSSRSRKRAATKRQVPPGPRGVTAHKLGSSLKVLSNAAQVAGSAWGWEPAQSSSAAEQWKIAKEDPLARTVAEADAHATMRSGLEHTDVLADTLSRGRAFVPLTIARAAAEHCLRAQYLLDPEVDDRERAGRRLNEWLLAASESERQRAAIVKAKHPRASEIPDASQHLLKVDKRAAELGFSVIGTRDRRHIAEVERRLGPMQLGERYLADDDAAQVTSTLFRTKNAVIHGLETGLLLPSASPC